MLISLVVFGTSALLVAWPKIWLRLGLSIWFLNPAVLNGLASIPGAHLFAAFGMVGNSRASLFVREKFVQVFIVIAALFFFSAIWSPDPQNAVGIALFTVLTAVMFVAVLGRTSSLKIAGSGLLVLSPFVLLQAGSTMWFANNFTVKSSYYGSAIADLLFGAVADEATSGQVAINGLAEGKAAGFLFTNGNRASMVMGVAALIYFAYGLLAKRFWAYVVAIVSMIGVVSTQSKTAWVLAVLIPVAGLLHARLADQLAGPGRLAAIPIGVIGFLVGILLLFEYGGVFLDRSTSALAPRKILWGTALQSVSENPLSGWGSGGWEDRWQTVAILTGEQVDYPPHNFLLFAGTKAGLPMVALQVAAVLAMVGFATRRMSVLDARGRVAAAMVGAAVWWVFWHGQADNTEFFGTTNTVPLLAIGFAMCYVIRRSAGAEHESENLVDGTPGSSVAKSGERAPLAYPDH